MRSRPATRRVVLGATGTALSTVAGTACGAGRGQQGPAQPVTLAPKISFYVAASAADHRRYWQQFGAWFAEEHPGTTVEAVLPPADEAYQVKLLTLFAARTVPDLFHLNNRYIRDYHGLGLLQPLEPLLRRVGFPTGDFIRGVLVPYRIDGQLFGFPRDNSTAVLYYNKDLFTASGVKAPDVSWTWDQFLAAAKQLSAPDRGTFGTTLPQVTTINSVPLVGTGSIDKL
ncbi:MAG: extracellular solute-binding protein [Chloroflexota bacterium]|nr:extracellular solute-binding protein [Chloroflexota bacterium]